MIKKRPEGEESTADEADVSDTEKVILIILQFTGLYYKLIYSEFGPFFTNGIWFWWIPAVFLPKLIIFDVTLTVYFTKKILDSE